MLLPNRNDLSSNMNGARLSSANGARVRRNNKSEQGSSQHEVIWVHVQTLRCLGYRRVCGCYC